MSVTLCEARPPRSPGYLRVPRETRFRRSPCVSRSNAKPSDGDTRPLLVTVDKACLLLSIGRTRLYELLGDRKLESILIGRRRLIKFSSIEHLISGGSGQ